MGSGPSTNVVDKVHEQGERRIESIRSDLLVQIGNKDLYHMECQMKRDGHMAVRMLEYDANIALREAEGDGKKIRFPQSAILYLDGAENIPDMETCTIIFQDGTEYEYQIPVMKVQGYTPEMACEKGLCILLPFLPIRFRRRFEAILKKKENPVKEKDAYGEMETLKKDLTKFIGECIMIIKREEENGTLSNRVVRISWSLWGKRVTTCILRSLNCLRRCMRSWNRQLSYLARKWMRKWMRNGSNRAVK